MNIPLLVIGGAIAAIGLILKVKQKDLTPAEKASKTTNTDHAQNMPSENNNETTINQNNSTTDDSVNLDLDDLGTNENPE